MHSQSLNREIRGQNMGLYALEVWGILNSSCKHTHASRLRPLPSFPHPVVKHSCTHTVFSGLLCSESEGRSQIWKILSLWEPIRLVWLPEQSAALALSWAEEREISSMWGQKWSISAPVPMWGFLVSSGGVGRALLATENSKFRLYRGILYYPAWLWE